MVSPFLFTLYVRMFTSFLILRSPDGQCLILSSRDGYCTLIAFDDIIPAYHTQQHTLQLQSIAHHNSVPLSYSSSHQSSSSAQVTPAATPSSANVNLPFVSNLPTASTSALPVNPKKRSEPPLTPAASVDGSDASYFTSSLSQASASHSSGTGSSGDNPAPNDGEKIQEPPKKKRRVALTRVGDLES